MVALAVLTGCTIDAPPGASPLRYRDTVFSNVTVTHDLQYGSAVPEGATTPIPLKLDLYQPTGDTRTSRPAIVWVHGGGYTGGDKGSGPSADLANKFAKLGYVTVSINYRLISGSGCTGSNGVSNACFAAALDAQHDGQAAVRWLRANAGTYNIDPTRIGMGGESAGAITATAVGLHSEDPGSSGNPGYSSKIGAFVSISGGLPGGVFASSGDAIGLLFHGDADPIVPFQWSVDTFKSMLLAGVPAFIVPLAGAGHVPYAQYGDLFFQQSDYFFYWFLDVAHAQGQPAAAARAADLRMNRLAKKHPGYAKRVRALKRSYRQYTR